MSNLRTDKADWRYQEYKYDPFFFQITFGLIAIILAVLIGFALFPDDMGYRSNLYTTAVGVLVTISVLDLLNRRRDEKQNEKELKEHLIRDFRSSVPEISRRAAEELDARGWLKDGSLCDKNFGAVQHVGATLVAAKMQRSQFGHARFRDANMMLVDCDGANLILSDFTNSNLMVANLKNTILIYSCMQGADLRLAKLQGANLGGSNLVNAWLEDAEYDETTILPDGENWTQTSSMSRFTNPNHPNFWQPTMSLNPV